MRLSAEVIQSAEQRTDPLGRREILLRSLAVPAIEHLSVTRDQFDVLDLSNNHLTRLENFPKLGRLETLYLGGNGVEYVDGKNLKRNCPRLKEIVLSGNGIQGWNAIGELGTGCPKLEFLSLVGNPVTKSHFARSSVTPRSPRGRDFRTYRHVFANTEKRRPSRCFSLRFPVPSSPARPRCHREAALPALRDPQAARAQSVGLPKGDVEGARARRAPRLLRRRRGHGGRRPGGSPGGGGGRFDLRGRRERRRERTPRRDGDGEHLRARGGEERRGVLRDAVLGGGEGPDSGDGGERRERRGDRSDRGDGEAGDLPGRRRRRRWRRRGGGRAPAAASPPSAAPVAGRRGGGEEVCGRGRGW
ncbi:hypothetical protein ACHAWF_018203, partial [Thalassiosira exigua]